MDVTKVKIIRTYEWMVDLDQLVDQKIKGRPKSTEMRELGIILT